MFIHHSNSHTTFPQAEGVLHSALSEGVQEGVRVLERWAAVQCLVHGGSVSAPIISELMVHLLDSHSPAEQARAMTLLALASKKTVRKMIEKWSS